MSKIVQLKSNQGENLYPNSAKIITNINGTAIKYADGTMICYNSQTLTSQNFNISYGVVYRTSDMPSMTFPVAFVETPTVMLKASLPGSIGDISTHSVSETSVNGYLWCVSNRTGTAIISYQAIGKWK